MKNPIPTDELLRDSDPELMRQFLDALVRMVRRCVPPEIDAEPVAREAMEEVVSRIASADKPVSLRMLATLAVSRAARRATQHLENVPWPLVTPDMLRRGDPEATRCFFARLVGIARRYIPDAAEAESVAREAMAEILARLDSDEEDEPVDLTVWARTAVGRAARKSIRRYKNAPVPLGPGTRERGRLRRSTVARVRDQLRRIGGVIETLPSITQRAIVATAVDGRTIESVATELGMPASTLRNQLRRARARFRKELSRPEAFERLLNLARQARLTHRVHSTRDESSVPG